MSLAERIVDTMKESAQDYKLERVHLGLIYSCVQLDNGAAGVSFTFPEMHPCGHNILKPDIPLSGRRAADIITHLGAGDLLASSLALATINALLASVNPPPEFIQGDILDILHIERDDQVCMVGCFLPLMAQFDRIGVKVVSVDQKHKPGAQPAEAVNSLLPESQIAIITATAIINSTIDHLLELAASCREVAILGSSTPMLKEAFTGTPVTSLSGIRVTRPDKVLQTIAEGGGFRIFKQFVEKVNLKL